MQHAKESMEQMKAEGKIPSPGASAAEQKEMEKDAMVAEAKKQDKMFFEFGVESEEIENATGYYMREDKEFAIKLQK
eukprot:CAMPEP_0176342690 /NCGR_PEP_ID=MMETSP0126-20121128/3363_1 /TAXON_ID=141414 ORGANISM="Strombidinopsis acuminatum, Strain SPMC142" /NCGR_SAMPLE_ID=MMETSP0126 /ASSEMBLY_ACC=CAM_ASM_000229 /LENGTH=76 /DNA_ID=CAMNT_0017688225 /DNA_START=376 /DNA_END=606 /DNA_ORIENTATION=-